MEQAKKRDHKIQITDVAIKKVPYIELSEMPKSYSKEIMEEHKRLLRVSKEINNCNEVLSVLRLKDKRKAMVLGSEFEANPSLSPDTYSIFISAGVNEIMFLHNHPSISLFSMADVVTFIRYQQIGVMSVVTNQGEVYILHKTSKYDYNKVSKIFNQVYTMYSEKKCDQAEAVKVFLKICERGGIKYVKGK